MTLENWLKIESGHPSHVLPMVAILEAILKYLSYHVVTILNEFDDHQNIENDI